MGRQIKKHLKIFISGMVMGSTTMIPGISFGTMTMMFNVYEKLLDALSIGHIRKNLHFSVPLLGGAVCGLFALSWLVTYLITYHEMITYFAFIGLIIGCVPMIYRKAEIGKIRPSCVLAFLIALGLIVYLAVRHYGLMENYSLEELGGAATPGLMVWIFIAGFISAVAMLIPGISGSIILLMLGAYTVALESVALLYLPLLIPVGAGIGAGIVVGIKLIKWLLERNRQVVYSAVLGLVIGSIAIIFPGFTADLMGAIAIAFTIGFVFVSYFVSRNG